jgi:hypothetical protein
MTPRKLTATKRISVSLPLSTERLATRAARQAKLTRSAWIAQRVDTIARYELELAKADNGSSQ